MLIKSDNASKEVILTRGGCVWFLWLNVIFTVYMTTRHFFNHPGSPAVVSVSLIILFLSLLDLLLTLVISRQGFYINRYFLLTNVFVFGVLWGLNIHFMYLDHTPKEFLILFSVVIIYPSVIAFHLSLKLIVAFCVPVLLFIVGEVLIFDENATLYLLLSYMLSMLVILSSRWVMLEWFKRAEKTEKDNIRLIKKLTNLADRDSLTGLSNKRFFREFFYSRTASVNAENSVYVIMIDVDFFKRYNDLYGHLSGDQCLMRISHCLKKSVRKDSDLVARFGGEEFVILLLSSDARRARTISQRIQHNLSELSIRHEDSPISDVVTVSQGIACWDNSSSLDALLSLADKHLYVAKREGRNRACFHQ